MPGVFLQKHPKQKGDRLWNIVELFTRQGRVLMLIHHLSRRTSKWCLASHHYPERYAERVQVRADVNGHPREVLKGWQTLGFQQSHQVLKSRFEHPAHRATWLGRGR